MVSQVHTADEKTSESGLRWSGLQIPTCINSGLGGNLTSQVPADDPFWQSCASVIFLFLHYEAHSRLGALEMTSLPHLTVFCLAEVFLLSCSNYTNYSRISSSFHIFLSCLLLIISKTPMAFHLFCSAPVGLTTVTLEQELCVFFFVSHCITSPLRVRFLSNSFL